MLTRDGIFHLTDICVDPESGRPALKGEYQLPLTERQVELIQEGELLFMGRSAHSQMGLAPEVDFGDMEIDKSGSMTVEGKFLSYRKETNFLAVQTEALKNPLKIGRVLFLGDVEVLSSSEIHEAVKKKLLKFPESTMIDDDGIVRIPVTPNFQHKLSHYIDKEENTKSVLSHGRNALVPFLTTRTSTNSPILKPQDFFLTGSRFSLGPFDALVTGVYVGGKREKGIIHLPARYLDGGRTNGTSPQWELFYNLETGEKVETNKISVGVKILKNEKYEPMFTGFSPEKREAVLDHGMVLSDLLGLDKVPLEQRIDPLGNNIWGIIKTPNGETVIPFEETMEGQSIAITEELRSGKRVIPDGEEDFYETYKESLAHKGRILETECLPSVRDLHKLADDLRVGVFKFRGLLPDKGFFQENPEKNTSNFYLDALTYQTIFDLSNKGIEFIWEIGDDDIRVFHHGFWCKVEEKERFDNTNVIFAEYGSHVEGFDDLFGEEMMAGNAEIIDIFGKERTGFTHGKGPGFMALADLVARMKGALSIGIGIGLEKLKQGTSFAPQVLLDFLNEDQSTRQNIMEELALFSSFNMGGIGTFEELGNTLCNTKLLKKTPVPIVMVDKTEGQDHYKNIIPALEGFERKTLTYKDKTRGVQTHDLPGYISPEWVSDSVVVVSSYHDRARVYKAFKEDPASFWKNPIKFYHKLGLKTEFEDENTGLTLEQIQMAIENQSKTFAKYGKSMPDFILEGFEKMSLEKSLAGSI